MNFASRKEADASLTPIKLLNSRWKLKRLIAVNNMTETYIRLRAQSGEGISRRFYPYFSVDCLACPEGQTSFESATSLSECPGENTLVVTSNYIIDETVTWLRYRDSHISAVDFLLSLWKHCANSLHLEWITQSIEGKAWSYSLNERI